MRHHDTTGYNPQLIGSIPSEIGGLAALNYLYVGSNGLNGSIPSEIGGLVALRELFIGTFLGVVRSFFGSPINLPYHSRLIELCVTTTRQGTILS